MLPKTPLRGQQIHRTPLGQKKQQELDLQPFLGSPAEDSESSPSASPTRKQTTTPETRDESAEPNQQPENSLNLSNPHSPSSSTPPPHPSKTRAPNDDMVHAKIRAFRGLMNGTEDPNEYNFYTLSWPLICRPPYAQGPPSFKLHHPISSNNMELPITAPSYSWTSIFKSTSTTIRYYYTLTHSWQ